MKEIRKPVPWTATEARAMEIGLMVDWPARVKWPDLTAAAIRLAP